MTAPGKSKPAAGEVIHVAGRVPDQHGRALSGARVMIFQANAHGRYNHPAHANSNLNLDSNFPGFGHAVTDIDLPLLQIEPRLRPFVVRPMLPAGPSVTVGGRLEFDIVMGQPGVERRLT